MVLERNEVVTWWQAALCARVPRGALTCRAPRRKKKSMWRQYKHSAYNLLALSKTGQRQSIGHCGHRPTRRERTGTQKQSTGPLRDGQPDALQSRR